MNTRDEFESLPVGRGSPGSGRVVGTRAVSDRLLRWGAPPNGTSCAIERMRHLVPVLATEARIGEGSDALSLNASQCPPTWPLSCSLVTLSRFTSEPWPMNDHGLDGRQTAEEATERKDPA